MAKIKSFCHDFCHHAPTQCFCKNTRQNPITRCLPPRPTLALICPQGCRLVGVTDILVLRTSKQLVILQYEIRQLCRFDSWFDCAHQPRIKTTIVRCI